MSQLPSKPESDADLLDELENLVIANAQATAWGAAVGARERIAAIRTRLKYRLSHPAQEGHKPVASITLDQLAVQHIREWGGPPNAMSMLVEFAKRVLLAHQRASPQKVETQPVDELAQAPVLVDDPNSASGKRLEYRPVSSPQQSEAPKT